MKISRLFAVIAAAGALAAVQPAVAQTATCENVTFHGDLLAKFPNIRDVCQEIIVRDGDQVAVLNAELGRVGSQTVSARFKKHDGGMTDWIRFSPPADFRVRVAGRDYRLREMGRGSELNMYVPVDSPTVAVHSGVDEEELVFVMFEAGDAEDMGDALPKTASNAPLFALLGGLFLLIAGGMTLRRRGNASA